MGCWAITSIGLPLLGGQSLLANKGFSRSQAPARECNRRQSSSFESLKRSSSLSCQYGVPSCAP